MVYRRLRRLRNALHEHFLTHSPLLGFGARMDHLLADAAVRAADADVLVGATEAAHRMPLEVREHEQRVVIQEMRANGHLREPLAALDGQHGCAGLIHDVDGREVPAVDGQGLPVLLRRVAVALIVSIRLDDLRLRQILRDELLDPRPRNDIRPVRLARVQLDADAPRDVRHNLLIQFEQSGGR